MRLWTVHPQYLDSKGLVALWREALLAQKVIAGLTKGYRHHPQLVRFQEHPNPSGAIASFLFSVTQEGERRGYIFDTTKIRGRKTRRPIRETTGQLGYEWQHLQAKLGRRAPKLALQHGMIEQPKPHPLFRIVPGDIANWEKRQPSH